jgi:type IV secretion system protein VirB6
MHLAFGQFRGAADMDVGGFMDGVTQWAFFKLLFSFLDGELMDFQQGLVGRAMRWVTTMALVLSTVWVLLQGYLIITGRSKESLMGLVVGALRTVLIVTAATSLAFGSSDIYKLLSNGLPQEINQMVTGSDEKPEESIDKNMTIMAGIFTLVDTLTVDDDPVNKENQEKVTTLTGIGIAGPSVVGGALLLLYKISLVMFVGFGPLFILCLMFEQTKTLFQRWLLYGLGTMFSLAVLAFMVSLATKVVAISGAAMLAQYYAASSMQLGTSLNAAAMQQGGVGLIMSVLMVMAPPMAAMFFGGTLGQFIAASSFGNVGRNSTGQDSDFRQRSVRDNNNDGAPDPWAGRNNGTNQGSQRERPVDLKRG